MQYSQNCSYENPQGCSRDRKLPHESNPKEVRLRLFKDVVVYIILGIGRGQRGSNIYLSENPINDTNIRGMHRIPRGSDV